MVWITSSDCFIVLFSIRTTTKAGPLCANIYSNKAAKGLLKNAFVRAVINRIFIKKRRTLMC